MDGKLLEILCCPVTRRQVSVLNSARQDALRNAVAEGSVQYVDGDAVTETFDDVLVTDDEKVLYLVIDGIPVMLPERGVGTTQFENFAAGQL
ncbi:MAG: hypothetical protein AAGE01_06140 [Pseudomonadota bacterium]